MVELQRCFLVWVAGYWCRTWRLITEFFALWVKIGIFLSFAVRLITKIIQVKCVIYITPAMWLILPFTVEGLFWDTVGTPLALILRDYMRCLVEIIFFYFVKESLVRNLCALFFLHHIMGMGFLKGPWPCTRHDFVIVFDNFSLNQLLFRARP